jgi:uncharacterized membrane-anchored protein
MTKTRFSIHIPPVSINYWLLMFLATTIGEIVGNLISRNLGLGYSTGSILLIGSYIVAVAAIALSQKDNAAVYWVLIVLGNIAGTNCADFITIEPMKLGTMWGSLLVMGVLTLILVVWRFVSPKSGIDTGLNSKTFFLYWLAILVSSTFGTTSGDLLSNDTPLGAGGGTLLLLIILAVFALLKRFTRVSKEILYWCALVAMHPIGATFGNYISKPAGLNFGNIWTSVGLVVSFVILFLENRQRRSHREHMV